MRRRLGTSRQLSLYATVPFVEIPSSLLFADFLGSGLLAHRQVPMSHPGSGRCQKRLRQECVCVCAIATRGEGAWLVATLAGAPTSSVARQRLHLPITARP